MSQPTRWRPANDLEIGLLAAQERHDRDGYLSLLATTDLLVPYPPETPDDAFGCVVTEVSGRSCMLAFTSEATMADVLGHDDLPYRLARFVQLDRGWPDPAIWLAVDPGRPIEIFLGAAAVGELAQLAAQPNGELEETLYATSVAGDPDGFAEALTTVDVVVPIDPDGADTRDVTDPEFPWLRIDYADRPVMVFTSPARLREQLSDQVEYIEVPFVAVASAWWHPAGAAAETEPTEQTEQAERAEPAEPAEGLPAELSGGLVVNPGTPFDGVFAAPLMRLLGEMVDKLVRSTIVQVVVPSEYVDRFLRDGHGRVAGLVHQRPRQATPLGALYHHLGLLGEGSPFRAEDGYGYVVRWFETEPDAYQEPQMGGVELGPGSSLWRIDQSGGERCLGRYVGDEDGGLRWVAAAD